jgi:hypothetical protein
MSTEEIKSFLEEAFFEEEYRIKEECYKKYGDDLKRFYIMCYSKKLKKHIIPMVTIQNYITGTAVHEDVWEMVWTLPTQNYYMNIPSEEDVKSFLMLSKEKLKEILLINEMNKNLLDDMVKMDRNPREIIRDFKLERILKTKR